MYAMHTSKLWQLLGDLRFKSRIMIAKVPNQFSIPGGIFNLTKALLTSL